MESSLISPLIHWLTTHPGLAGLTIFLITFLESLPFIGLLVPSSIIMVAIGGLVGMGYLNLMTMLLATTSAAIIGDCVSFSIGYYLQDRIETLGPFKRYPKWLISGREYFSIHGGKSIFLGRFLGPLRGFVPLIAGTLHFPMPRFLFANITSACTWAPLLLLPGFAFSLISHALAPGQMLTLFTRLIIILLLIWLVFRISHYLLTRSSRQVYFALYKLNKSLQNRRWYHPIHRVLVPSKQKKYHRNQLALLLLCIILFLLFWSIAYSSSLIDAPKPINAFIHTLFQNLRARPIEPFMLLTSILADKVVLLPATILTSLFLIKRGHTRFAMLWLSLLTATSASIWLVKHGLSISRPSPFNLASSSSSFPSGHTALAMVYFGFTFLQAGILAHISVRRVYFLLTITLVTLVGISRLYLGVHWLTDILGAIVLGLFWISVFSFYERRFNFEIPASFPILAISNAIIVWALFSASQWHAQIEKYNTEKFYHPHIVSNEVWWNTKSERKIYYRRSRLGKKRELINIQWAGELSTIEQKLHEQSWHKAPENRFKKLLHPEKSPPHWPWLPTPFEGHPPSLVMYQVVDTKTITVLRLWAAPIKLQNSPIWLGTTTLQSFSENDFFTKPLKEPAKHTLSALKHLQNTLNQWHPACLQFKVFTTYGKQSHFAYLHPESALIRNINHEDCKLVQSTQ